MKNSKSTEIISPRKMRHSSSINVFVVVFFFAVLQMIPALINGYPFIFFDSRGYHNAGQAVVQTVLGKSRTNRNIPSETFTDQENLSESPVASPSKNSILNNKVIPMSRSPYYGAIFYSFFKTEIFFLVLFQSLIVAYVSWLVVKQVFWTSRVKPFLIAGIVCATLTPLPYFVAYAMPDVFVGLIPLCIFLICYSNSRLSPIELLFCWLILTASISFHTSHTLLTVGLLLTLLIISAWRPLRPSFFGWVASLFALSIGILSVVLFAYVSKVVFGSWPQNIPFLTARGIEDGPVIELINNDCGGYKFAVCQLSPLNSPDSQQFLWDREGPFQTADYDTKQKLSDEDLMVFLTAARAYPKMQVLASFKNFIEQLSLFGLHEFYTARRVFVESATNYMDDINLKRFQNSLAVKDHYPFAAISIIIYVTSLVGLFILAYNTKYCRKAKSTFALTILIFSALLLNSIICGMLSDPHHRYQARIIWLLPFFATLLFLQLSYFRKCRGSKTKY